MELFEYIKKSYKTPNPFVVKGLGGSDELVEYLRKTPWNTNLNVVGSIANPSGGGDAEVWLVGDTSHMGEFALSNVDSVDHITELYNNGSNYQIFLNGVELPYLINLQGMVMWANSDEDKNITKAVVIDGSDSPMIASASWFDEPAPTSVEVSVKTK